MTTDIAQPDSPKAATGDYNEAHYVHRPLSHLDNIRLLQLLPSQQESSVIRCRIFESALLATGTPRPFEALSYCWGSDDRTHHVFVADVDKKEGQELKVTPNLYAALVRFRDHDIARVIWIDAICIDQTNDKEKENQIPLMAMIYGRASV
jgi:hypothetical protein